MNACLSVLSDDELGFADLASPGTIENLRHNSAIELNVVDPITRRGFRFKGAAQVMKDPEAHGRIARVLGPDYPFEQVVKIRVETASEVFSPVYTLPRSSEADVKRFWLERYGYRSIREAGGVVPADRDSRTGDALGCMALAIDRVKSRE
jgi:hypothetical protein